jgi:organic radical activating enzyme
MTVTIRQAHRPAPAASLRLEPEVLTILGTYKCTAMCENCCFGSNPYLTQRLDLDRILAFITAGARHPNCKLVVFSGGECFLLRSDLNAAIEHATSLGLSTRCVTNGYWAKRMAHGRDRLAGLVASGLKELNISTGDHHQRWVSQEAVVNAACLSVELGLAETVVVVEMQKERRVTGATLAQDPRIRTLIDDPATRFHLIESPWMPMDHEATIDQLDDVLLSRRTLHLRGGCGTVLKTLVLTPDNKVGSCCGLTREQIPELNASWDGDSLDPILAADARDFMKIWLYVDGPERILAWAATVAPEIRWEDRYAHRCHTCLVLFKDPIVRRVIREHYRERVDDVLARFTTRLRIQQGLKHGIG